MGYVKRVLRIRRIMGYVKRVLRIGRIMGYVKRVLGIGRIMGYVKRVLGIGENSPGQHDIRGQQVTRWNTGSVAYRADYSAPPS